MNTVEPIRDKEKVIDIAEYLRKDSERNYVMFLFGIYSGLRISDILKFRVRDVKNKNDIVLREKKTGKEKRFPINRDFKKALEQYITGKDDYEFLFKNPHENKPHDSKHTTFCLMQERSSELRRSEHIRCVRHLGITFTSQRKMRQC